MDLYSVMQLIISPEETQLKSGAFTDEKMNLLNNEADKIVFVLLRNIASLGVKYEKSGIKFYPMMEFADGTRSFSVEDLTDNDYTILYSISLQDLPLLIRTRIAEVLWGEKRDHEMADIACLCNYRLYLISFDSSKWSRCFKYLSNATELAVQINSKEYIGILQNIHDKIIELGGKDPSFLSIRLIGLLLDQKRWNKYDEIIPVIDNIISIADNVQKVREAFELKTKIIIRQGNKELAMENNRRLAFYLKEKAAMESTSNIQSLFTSVQYLQDAIQLYRNNNARDLGEQVHKKLIELQKRIPHYMVPITSRIDVSKTHEDVMALFDNLSFREHILRITQITPLFKKEELKKKVLDDASNPLSQLFNSKIISSTGQTTAQIRSIDINNPEKDAETLNMHMHHKALQYEQICGETTLKWAQDLLIANFKFTKDDLRFLVENNPIVPSGRENIFLSGLFYGMMGKIYEALHILAPQVENLFRCVAEECGAVIVKLNDDNTSEAKMLRKVFDTPELLECYDNDILFLFKGLLNEKSGANIRNEIAHGLMGERIGNAGASRFFFWWVVKILSFTSIECRRILLSENS